MCGRRMVSLEYRRGFRVKPGGEEKGNEVEFQGKEWKRVTTGGTDRLLNF